MTFKKTFIVSLMLLFSILLTACVSNEPKETSSSGSSDTTNSNENIEFKISHVAQDSHIFHAIAEKFGEELDSATDGRMSVTIYPAAQLGGEPDIVSQLESGALDFGFMTNAYMGTREPSVNAWFMPYLFNNLEEAVEMRNSEEAKAMLDSLSSQGLVGLDFAFAGNRHTLLKNGFVEEVSDLKGKKIRIIGSPVMQEYWTQLGAGPTSMSLTEVYQSLQTGVIDGIDIDLDALVTEKYYEQANYLTLTNQMTFPTAIVGSQVKFNSLSESDQQIVREALSKAVDWGLTEAISREEANLQALKDAGVKIKEDFDPSIFAQPTQLVREEFSKQSDIIKTFVEKAEK